MFTRVPKPEVNDHRNPPGYGPPQIIDKRQKIFRKGGVDLNSYDSLKSQRDALLTADLQFKKRITALEKDQFELVKSHETVAKQNKMLKAHIEHGPPAAKLKKLQTEIKEQDGVIEQLQDINKRLVQQLTLTEQRNNTSKDEKVIGEHWRNDAEKIKAIREQRKRMREKQMYPDRGPFDGTLSKPKNMFIREEATGVKDAYDRALDDLEKETQSLLVKIKQVKIEKEQIDWAMIVGDRKPSKNVTLGNDTRDKLNKDLYKFAARLDEIRAKHEAASAFTDLVSISRDGPEITSVNNESKNREMTPTNLDVVRPVKSYKRNKIAETEKAKNAVNSPPISPANTLNQNIGGVKSDSQEALSPIENGTKQNMTTQFGSKTQPVAKSYKANKHPVLVEEKENPSTNTVRTAVQHEKNGVKETHIGTTRTQTELAKSPEIKNVQIKTPTENSNRNSVITAKVSTTTPVKITKGKASNLIEYSDGIVEGVARAPKVTSTSEATMKKLEMRKNVSTSVDTTLKQERNVPNPQKVRFVGNDGGRYDNGPEPVGRQRVAVQTQSPRQQAAHLTQKTSEPVDIKLTAKATKKKSNAPDTSENEYDREYNAVLRTLSGQSEKGGHALRQNPTSDSKDTKHVNKLQDTNGAEKSVKRNQVSPMPINFKSNGRMMDGGELHYVLGNSGIKTENPYKVY